MLFDTLHALEKLKPPESLKKIFKEILDDFSIEPIADTIDTIDSLLKD
jgi:uracil DNA glycosylase